MDRETIKQKSKPQQQTLLIIWLGLTFAILIYALIVFIIARRAEGSEVPAGTLSITAVLSLVAVGTGAFSLFWRRRVVGQPKRLLQQIERDGLSEGYLSQLIQRYVTGGIVCWALNEGIATYGLVLAIISNSGFLFVPFAIAALVLNIMMFPRLFNYLAGFGLTEPSAG